MQYVILGLLLAGPLSLYDLHKHFSAGVSLFYSASFGSLQRALGALVAAGDVTTTESPTGARRRTLHTITPSGRERWRDWMLSPVSGSQQETTMLSRVFFLAQLSPGDRPAALEQVRARALADLAALREVETALADTSQVPAELHETHRYRSATLDYGIRSHELALAWLDDLDATR